MLKSAFALFSLGPFSSVPLSYSYVFLKVLSPGTLRLFFAGISSVDGASSSFSPVPGPFSVDIVVPNHFTIVLINF